MKPTSVLLLALLSAPATISAQEYEPRELFPSEGSEVVLVFISDAYCSGNGEERLDDAIRGVKRGLKARFERDGAAFFAVGAAAQWGVESGVDYLVHGIAPGYSNKDFGAWDEIWVGRSWLNNGAIEHIWRGDQRSTIPQLVVFRRDVVSTDTGFQFGPEQVIARIVGSREIVAWFDEGMPTN